MAFQTEYNFVLPRGYLDREGVLHKEGVMRLANAGDEILPLKDPRVQQNPGYLTVILLARVITKLGSLPAVDTRVVVAETVIVGQVPQAYFQLDGSVTG